MTIFGSVVKNPPANARDSGDSGSVSGLGRSPGVGNDNLFRCSCLENSMDRGAWRVTVHGVTRSGARLNTHIHNTSVGTKDYF